MHIDTDFGTYECFMELFQAPAALLQVRTTPTSISSETLHLLAPAKGIKEKKVSHTAILTPGAAPLLVRIATLFRAWSHVWSAVSADESFFALLTSLQVP